MSWSLSTAGKADQVAAYAETNLAYATKDDNGFPSAEREACKRVVEILKGIAAQDSDCIVVVDGNGSMWSDANGIGGGSFKLELRCIRTVQAATT